MINGHHIVALYTIIPCNWYHVKGFRLFFQEFSEAWICQFFFWEFFWVYIASVADSACPYPTLEPTFGRVRGAPPTTPRW